VPFCALYSILIYFCHHLPLFFPRFSLPPPRNVLHVLRKTFLLYPCHPCCRSSSPCCACLYVLFHLTTTDQPRHLPLPDFFQVTSPTQGTKWVNGQTYPVTWTKGLLDGIARFDLELTRMNTDGLIFIARDGALHSAFILLFFFFPT
jgi:hypothetical protein